MSSVWSLGLTRVANNARLHHSSRALMIRGPTSTHTSLQDNSRLEPCCRLGGLALLLSAWMCEAPVTDGRDILPYLLPFRVTCNMYSFLQTTTESRQLSIPLPAPPCMDQNTNSPKLAKKFP